MSKWCERHPTLPARCASSKAWTQRRAILTLTILCEKKFYGRKIILQIRYLCERIAIIVMWCADHLAVSTVAAIKSTVSRCLEGDTLKTGMQRAGERGAIAVRFDAANGRRRWNIQVASRSLAAQSVTEHARHE